MQQKLQMRIEAQGKYLQAILDKAKKSLPDNMNSPNAQEATTSHLPAFDSPLSNLMDYGENRDYNIELPTSSYIVEKEQKKDMNLYKLKEDSINFDLNSRSSYIWFLSIIVLFTQDYYIVHYLLNFSFIEKTRNSIISMKLKREKLIKKAF